MKTDTDIYGWRDGVLTAQCAVEIDYENAEELYYSGLEISKSVPHATLYIYWNKNRSEWYFRWIFPLNLNGVIRCATQADVLLSIKFFVAIGFSLDRWIPVGR